MKLEQLSFISMYFTNKNLSYKQLQDSHFFYLEKETDNMEWQFTFLNTQIYLTL